MVDKFVNVDIVLVLVLILVLVIDVVLVVGGVDGGTESQGL